jgi:hypothetical protein
MVMTSRPVRQKMRLRRNAFKAHVLARYTQACDCFSTSMAQSQLSLSAHIRGIAVIVARPAFVPFSPSSLAQPRPASTSDSTRPAI